MGSIQQQSILKGKSVDRDMKTALVHKIFQNAQVNFPHQTAIFYEDDNGEEYSVCYEELESCTNKLSRTLRQYCKSRDDCDSIIAVSMKPTHRLPIILLSILKCGMAYLPLDIEFPVTRVKHIIEESQPILVIIDDGDKSVYDEIPVITYHELWERSRNESEKPFNSDDNTEQLAIVLYTSGSTGIPKGVRIPHATLLNRLEWQWRELPFRHDEQKTIFKTALTFVDSAPELWGALLQGRTIVVVPKHVTKDPEKFIDILEKHQIKRLVLVPSLLQSMLMYLNLQKNNDALQHLKLWICSGEILSQSLAKNFFDRFNIFGHTLANFYGSTEIMGDVTYYLMHDFNQLENLEKVPIGRPLDNCIIYIVDKDLRLVSQGEVGELVVAGRNLAAGYIRGRDSHRFINNPHVIDPGYSTLYRTGDYARIMKGIIYYEGRSDSQIKVRGHRVDLTEVELSIMTMPAVDKAVVLCYKPGELSQALIAFVTVKNKTNVTRMQIEDYLKSRLSAYMMPQIMIVNIIPLLINGKTDRQALLRMYETTNYNLDDEERIECDYSDVPNDKMQMAKILFPTVSSIIGHSSRFTVNISANFYELGGNSLNSIYTVTKLRELGYHIGITDFLTAKTMREILCKMTKCGDSYEETKDDPKFIIEQMDESHKTAVTHIVTESFYLKADLERWLAPDVTRNDYYDLMDTLWRPIVDKELSFVVRSENDVRTILGTALSFDAWDEPDCIVTSKLSLVFEFLEYLEGPIRNNKLPRGKGKILHCYMMATNQDLTPAENVIIMNKMEEEIINLAKKRGFIGIFTTNTSPLTQQLDTDVYGYEVLLDYQVNEYIASDGTKPFGKAPDDQRALCSWKAI
ncbi:hypothetical protein PV326_002925 [Microctonus aethiopoides]|nr:hypothetical protein PV326_002925 [Microctonus aethiopoides]